MSYKVCIVSGSRAEYDLLKPIIIKLENDTDIDCSFVITGSHLDSLFGGTQASVISDGMRIAAKIKLPLTADSKADMAKSTAVAISEFTDYFEENHFDFLILLGDRFEIYGVAFAAAMLGIPIAHLYGGDTTEGAADEFMRHGITKMSYLHFTSCEEYRKRVIQLGESPGRVFNVGSMGVENCLNLPLLSLEELEKQIEFKIDNNPYAVVTFHPVTLENLTMEQQMTELMEAMDGLPDFKYIITKSNADAGGRLINQMWESNVDEHANWFLVSSLGAVRYLSALKYSKFVLGNSSSGISEAPSMKIPTVNIGDRQKGRVMADSLICCEPKSEGILAAMKKAISPEFQEMVQKTESPFGDGNTSDKIINELKKVLNSQDISLKKKFYDIRED